MSALTPEIIGQPDLDKTPKSITELWFDRRSAAFQIAKREIDLSVFSDLDAEELVLGILLTHAKARFDHPEIFACMRAQVFTLPEHKMLWMAATNIWARNEEADLIAMVKEFRALSAADRNIDSLRLRNVLMQVTMRPDAAVTSSLGRAMLYLQQLTCDRQAIFNLAQALHYIKQHPDKVAEVSEKVIQEMAIIPTLLPQKSSTLQTAAEHAVSRALERQQSPERFRGMVTYLEALDDRLYGLKKGEMSVIAARPSHGKTSFMLHFASEQAKRGIPGLIISLEMTAESLIDGLITYEAQVRRDQFTKGLLNEQDLEKVKAAANQIAKWPIDIVYIDGSQSNPATPAAIVGHIRSHWEKAKKTKGVKIVTNNLGQKHLTEKHVTELQWVCIDHCLLVRPSDPRENVRITYRNFSTAMMQMAKQLNIHVMIFTQINRTGKGIIPDETHIAETDQLVQDASSIITLYRPEQEGIETITIKGEQFATQHLAIARVCKNRTFQETGIVLLNFGWGRFLKDSPHQHPQLEPTSIPTSNFVPTQEKIDFDETPF